MVFVFWGLVATLVYVYVGYPCLIWLIGRLRPWPVAKAPHLPTVSLASCSTS